MKVMLEGSALLEKKSIGTNAARTAIWNVACIAYYRATGLWLENDKEPRGTNLTWVQGEVLKQDELLKKEGN